MHSILMDAVNAGLPIVTTVESHHPWSRNGTIGVVVQLPDDTEEYVTQSHQIRSVVEIWEAHWRYKFSLYLAASGPGRKEVAKAFLREHPACPIAWRSLLDPSWVQPQDQPANHAAG